MEYIYLTNINQNINQNVLQFQMEVTNALII